MDYMDWKAAMSSEIFREYVKIEMEKERIKKEAKVEEIDKDAILKQFFEVEKMIISNPQIKTAFKTLRDQLMAHPEYIESKKIDKKFAEAIMLFDLDDE